MAPHSPSGLAPDTGPIGWFDVADDVRPVDGLDGPTVATRAVEAPEDATDETPEDPTDETGEESPEGSADEPTGDAVDEGADESDETVGDGADASHEELPDEDADDADLTAEDETDDASARSDASEQPGTSAQPDTSERAEASEHTGDAPRDGLGTDTAPDADEAAPEAEPATEAEPDDDAAAEDESPLAASTVPVAPVVAVGTTDDDTTAIPISPARRRFSLVPRSRWVRRTLATLAVVLLVLAAVATPSLVHALTRPGSDTVAARIAEWGRDHGLGPAVTWLEARQYQLDQPATGGAPAGGIPHASGAVVDHPGGSPAPPPLPSPPGVAPLPGEGQWQTVVSTPHGDAERLATVRPDAAHTSFLVGVLWMDPKLVQGVLHPGTEDPGGDWSVPPSVDSDEQRTVVSAFSAGFRLQGDSHGGWYLDGREGRPLVPGAASLVLHRNGTADVGAWGSEVRMTPDVAAVRQNLIPLVDHGVVNPTCATGGTAEWGSTVGQAAYIARSAFGVTATGAEIYVGGPALSVCTLGDILRSAGAVRGMELDINPAWVSGAYFHPTGQPHPDAFQLFPGEQVGAQHYLQTSSRDFVSFDLRSVADATGAGSTPATSQHHGGKHQDSGDKHHP